jgi:hypothetical protein
MIAQTESERLLKYHAFDEDVLASVEEVANVQRKMDFNALNSTLPDNKPFYPISEGKPIEVIDTGPSDDNERTLVYHSWMGAGLDANLRARMATLSAALPTTRIIIAGSPGAPGSRSGRLAMNQVPSVWGGDLRATVDPLLQYVQSQGLSVITHGGYSYGADKAPVAAALSSEYDQMANQVISVEPSSVKLRKFLWLESLGIVRLGLDFNSADAALEGYVLASNSQALIEARELAATASHGKVGLLVGLLKPSNIAASKALSKDGFAGRMTKALIKNPEMRADTIWGSLSELSISGLTTVIVEHLVDQFGPERVSGTIIDDQKHTMCDDIFLHTAIISQALKKNTK